MTSERPDTGLGAAPPATSLLSRLVWRATEAPAVAFAAPASHSGALLEHDEQVAISPPPVRLWAGTTPAAAPAPLSHPDLPQLSPRVEQHRDAEPAAAVRVETIRERGAVAASPAEPRRMIAPDPISAPVPRVSAPPEAIRPFPARQPAPESTALPSKPAEAPRLATPPAKVAPAPLHLPKVQLPPANVVAAKAPVRATITADGPAAPAQPVIHVTIGRLEVRSPAPARAERTMRRTTETPTRTLEQYLAERREGRRR